MESKNKVLMGMIVAVVIVFAAVGTYLVFNKISTNEKEEQGSNTNGQEEQVVPVDVESELAKKLISYVSISDSIFYKKEKVALADLDTASQYEMAFKEIEKEGITLGCDLTTMNEINQSNDAKEEDCFAFEYTIPEQNLEKALRSVLGEKATPSKSETPINFHFKTKWKYKDLSLQKGLSPFKDENFESFIGSDIFYDKNKKMFVGTYETQGGGWADDGIYSKVESASKKGKVVTITEKIIFVGLNPITPDVVGYPKPTEYIIYADSNYSKKIGKLNIDDYDNMLHGNSSKSFGDLVNDYADKAMTVIYTFEENGDGSYHFVSSEIQK